MKDKPVRILMLFTIMNRGGAETMVMNYYRNIDRSKIQFDFMVHREERGAYDDEIELLGGKIYRMLPIYPQNFYRYKKELKHFFSIHKEYQIIHSHMSELGYFAFKEAKKQGRVKVRICHAHNAPYGWDLKMVMRTYFKKAMLPYVTHMFVCSKKAGNWLFGKEHKDDFIMMNNAIDAKKFRFNLEYSKQLKTEMNLENRLVIGHVGRFNKQKNHKFIIEIFNEIYRKNKNSVLILIGGGTEKEIKDIKKQINLYGLTNAVKFMGVQKDVSMFMHVFDIFLFPSLFEGLPVTLIEAQASGLPCVISDTISDQVIITPLVNKYSLNFNAKQWASYILENNKKISKIDTYRMVQKTGFDIKQNAKWLEEFYLNEYKKSI